VDRYRVVPESVYADALLDGDDLGTVLDVVGKSLTTACEAARCRVGSTPDKRAAQIRLGRSRARGRFSSRRCNAGSQADLR